MFFGPLIAYLGTREKLGGNMKTLTLAFSLLSILSVQAQEQSIETMENIRSVSEQYQSSFEATQECDPVQEHDIAMRIITGIHPLGHWGPRNESSVEITNYYCGMTAAVEMSKSLDDGELAARIGRSYVCGTIRVSESNPFEIIPLNASNDAEELASDSTEIVARIGQDEEAAIVQKLNKLKSICAVADQNIPNRDGFQHLTSRNEREFELNDNTSIIVGGSENPSIGIKVNFQ